MSFITISFKISSKVLHTIEDRLKDFTTCLSKGTASIIIKSHYATLILIDLLKRLAVSWAIFLKSSVMEITHPPDSRALNTLSFTSTSVAGTSNSLLLSH